MLLINWTFIHSYFHQILYALHGNKISPINTLHGNEQQKHNTSDLPPLIHSS